MRVVTVSLKAESQHGRFRREHLVMSALGRRCTYGWPQRCARSALGGIGLEKAASDARKQTTYLITPQHPDWGLISHRSNWGLIC